MVAGTEAENLRFGVDPVAWVNEGLVDTLIPYSSATDFNSSVDAWSDPRGDRLLRESRARQQHDHRAQHDAPPGFSRNSLRRRASGLYRAGVQHLFFWDCAGGDGRANFSDMWSALRRLGHIDEIENWKAGGETDLSSTHHELRTLGDWDLTYHTPG